MKPNKFSALSDDVYRLSGRRGLWPLIKCILKNRPFRAVFTMRICQSASGKGHISQLILPFLKIFHRSTTRRAGIDLPWRTKIGPGFAITHGWGAVINSGATIGRNVTLFHGVTIGRRDSINRDGIRTSHYPIIEDEVWIGPNACIVGGVTIGRGTRVAAGAFVTRSCPEYTVVIGNPARIVKTDVTPDVMNPTTP